MRLIIRTSVNSRLVEVKSGFTSELFLKLSPPFPPVKLVRFDGCNKGDRVHLQLNFLLFKQEWISDITSDNETETAWYFVDEGSKLPFFLKMWRHHHGVNSLGERTSQIVDDITYSTGTILTDLLLYPILYLQFLYRKPIYRRRFKS